MDTLERKLAYRLDRNGALNGHQYTGAYEDLPRLGFVTKPRGDIGYCPDRRIIEATLKTNGAERGKSVRNADPETNVMSQTTPLLHQGPNSDTHFESHQNRLERGVVYRNGIIEDYHHAVARVAFKRATVLDNDFTNRRMVVAQQRHHIFRVRAFGEACEAAQIAK